MVRSGLLGGVTGTCSDTGGGMSLQGGSQRVRENDEEIQREESSSTESTHQEVVNRFLRTHTCGENYIICDFL